MKINLIVLLVILCNLCKVAASVSGGPDTLYIPDAKDKNRETIEVYDQNGVMVYTGRLVNHKKEGVFRSYSESANITDIQEYHNDLPDGVHLVFGDNISLEIEENFRNGLLHGRRQKYRFGGILKLKEFYVDGKPDSVRIAYYDNGFKQEESIYKNGVRDGVAKWFNQSEQLLIEYHYKNGLLDGPAATFHNNGKPEQQGLYVNDREEGEWKHYDADGKHIKSVFYDKGKVTKEKVY